MYCIHCGQRLSENARFCPSCGAAQRAETAPGTAPQPTPPQPQAKKPSYFDGLRNDPYWARVRSCEIGMMWYIGLIAYLGFTGLMGLTALAIGIQGLDSYDVTFAVLTMLCGTGLGAVSVLGIYDNMNFKKRLFPMVLANFGLQLLECLFGLMFGDSDFAVLWAVLILIIAGLAVLHYFYLKNRLKYLS